MQTFSDARVALGEPGRGRQRVVRLELDHGPDRDPHRGKRLFERMKLRPERGLDAVARLVAQPKLVAKGLDHVIRRDTDVGRAGFEHLENGVHDADDSPVGLVLPLVEAALSVEVPEQLVRAIEEVNDHGFIIGFGRRSIVAPPRSHVETGARAAGTGAIQQQLSLARVSSQVGRALELRGRFVESSDLLEEIASHRRQQVIPLQR